MSAVREGARRVYGRRHTFQVLDRSYSLYTRRKPLVTIHKVEARSREERTLIAAMTSVLVSPVRRSASPSTRGSGLMGALPVGTLSTSRGCGGGAGEAGMGEASRTGGSGAFDEAKKGMVLWL